VSSQTVLREHQLAVHADLKDAALRWDQRQLLDLLLELEQQLLRRTDGLRRVLSLRAVLDADACAILCHRCRPPLIVDRKVERSGRSAGWLIGQHA
jgi:hypothetical protein